MPSVLRDADCPSCGHLHHFCLPAGTGVAGRENDYHCPETGARRRLRAAAMGEQVHAAPQGAVALTAAENPGGE